MRTQLFFFFLLINCACLGAGKKQLDILQAMSEKTVAVHAKSLGGLGTANLEITITNLRRDTSYIKMPPGLHFKSTAPDRQDLMTISEVMFALGPGARKTIRLQGFCEQASKYIPSVSSAYSLAGFAGSNLKGLSELLYKHQALTEDYGQMFVWALTDNRTMYDVSVDSSSVDAATSAIAYVAERTGQKLTKVYIDKERLSQPKLEVFSKKSSLAFHNPTEQVASFVMYDADGNIMHTLYRDRKLGRGVKVHEFGMNDIIPAGTDPTYYFRVIAGSGKVLAEKKVNRSTAYTKIEPELLKFTFEYQLKAPVKEARLKVYLLDGTLLEEFKRYTNLQPGNYAIDMKFLHVYPPDTQFVAKMEGPDGVVYKELIVRK